MDNGEKKISSLFDGRTVFQIPSYQRAYSWEKKQLLDFAEDIKNQKIDRSYFLGTVLFEEKKPEKNYEIIDIVDGQQRLTTVIIFMSVLIQLLKDNSSGEDEDEDIDLLYETYIKYKKQYKLRALEEDNDFFQNYILENKSGKDFIRTPAQRKLFEAKNYFSEYLSEFDKEKLDVIKRKIDENSRVLVYSVADTAEATLIFETTNDRGKGLTNLEKTKSFMMYKSYLSSDETPDELLKTIRLRFSEIYKEYEKYENRIDEDSILQYHFIGHLEWKDKDYRNYVVKVKEVVNDLIAREEDAQATSFIEKYTTELKETFIIVHEILTSKLDDLRNIFILGRVSNFWPLLIKVYKLDETEDKNRFSSVAKLLEVYSFRVYAIGKKKSNSGQSKLYKYAKNFKGNFEELEDGLKEIILEYGNDDIFKSSLSDPYIYRRLSSSDLSYFFWKYENYLRTSKQPKSSPMSEDEFLSKDSKYKFTIEHIASQTPKKSIINDSSILPDMTGDFNETYLHSIGNLTIDPHSSNSSKNNDDFEGKNTKFFTKAPFKTQNELEEFLLDKLWTADVIENRKKKLIQFAMSQWGI